MRFTQTILRGIGQVMFQNNVYSGILFLGGIFYESYISKIENNLKEVCISTLHKIVELDFGVSIEPSIKT